MSVSTLRQPLVTRVAIVCIAAMMVALSACEGIFDSKLEGPEGPGLGGIEDEVALLINDHRESLGCPRLVWNRDLAEVALAHSIDMLQRNYFGHVDPEGRDLRRRLREADIRYNEAAENIAKGFRYEDPARAVFRGWLESPDHRQILEDCSFVLHGIGFAEYSWTHVFVN